MQAYHQYGVGLRGFVDLKKWCTRLAAASHTVYQLLPHGWCFFPCAPASSTTNLLLQDKKTKQLQLRNWQWKIRIRIHHHPSSHCSKSRLHKENMYNSSYNIIHRDSFCKNNHTSHKLKGLGIFQVDMVTTSQCHNKCHHGK